MGRLQAVSSFRLLMVGFKEVPVQKIEVKLETVTPLFLGGAEPRGEPELRLVSFLEGKQK